MIRVLRNNKFRCRNQINHKINNGTLFTYFFSNIILMFLRKTEWSAYNFSWLNFDKIFSQKRCERMLNRAYPRPVRGIPSSHIPHNVVRKDWFRVLILPISSCDKAHFVVRNGPYQRLKWPISQAEMGFFAMRKNTL